MVAIELAHHLAADDAAAQQGDAQRRRQERATLIRRPRRADRLRSRGGSARGRHRRGPRRPAGAARGCSCWPSSGGRPRWTATATQIPGRRSAGSETSGATRSPLSQCFPTTVTMWAGAVAAPGDQRHRVARAVERRADVVAHAAVDADIGAQARQVLDGAHLVDGDGAGTGDGPARLDGEVGNAQARVGAGLGDERQHPLGHLVDVQRRVLAGVRDAEAAAEIELGQLDAVRIADGREQADEPLGRQPETGGVEDLRADVGVQADELERLRVASTWSTAASAAPDDSEKPNFWSSWPVETYSWVCASTPGVTRSRPAGGHRLPRRRRRAARSPRWNRRATRPTP